MMPIVRFAVVGLCLVISGCTTKSLFPSDVIKDVSPTFDFVAWRGASPDTATGMSASGTKVELGGRIVQANKNGNGIVIVAEELPIVNHPVYGPTESVKRAGEFEFAFLYPGELDPAALGQGNRFILIGTTSGRKPLIVNGAPKTEPFLMAQCIHIWQTGRSEIASFLENVGAGYSPLPERTYCAPSKK